MTTEELIGEKVYYADIKRLLEEGYIEKIRRGYYHWVDDGGESDVLIINRLFPEAILCMETALLYYEYSDRNSIGWCIAIDRNASKSRTNVEYPIVKAYRMNSDILSVGETKGEIDSHKIRIYDRDRTICDVLKNKNKMDREIFNKAIQGYVKDPKKNIDHLMEYASILRVRNKVDDILGVWLS